MFRTIIDFLWEWIVGKEVKPGQAIRHHKTRLLFFVVLVLSLGYNIKITDRFNLYYEAFEELKTRYSLQKGKIKTLEEGNQKLIESINMISHGKPPKCTNEPDKNMDENKPPSPEFEKDPKF
ncbi:hypothetical protein [Neisseria sp. P0024.S002]|uniref:hypothetical protein n=1 Tax=Neisseria sp. P0024.S002 TaxID=3436846 RepID=UPI003F8040C9